LEGAHGKTKTTELITSQGANNREREGSGAPLFPLSTCSNELQLLTRPHFLKVLYFPIVPCWSTSHYHMDFFGYTYTSHSKYYFENKRNEVLIHIIIIDRWINVKEHHAK
jgi:hypothetical protein